MCGVRIVLAAGVALLSTPAFAASIPQIVTGPGNAVPACVQPARLMQFVEERNATRRPVRAIESRFGKIAFAYQKFGACVARAPEKCVGVRWDYAFFQMLIETNYLTFRRPDGAPGGVPASDNNFAGIGATVRGRPGEHFKDVDTGVLAHLQHVLMYSTTRVPEPVAQRTRQVQDDVQAIMRRLDRPVTFADLARVWTGTDKNTYGADMQRLAEKYARRYCGPQAVAERQ